MYLFGSIHVNNKRKMLFWIKRYSEGVMVNHLFLCPTTEVGDIGFFPVCLSVRNFNLAQNFRWWLNMYHMYISCEKTVLLVPKVLTFEFDVLLRNPNIGNIS